MEGKQLLQWCHQLAAGVSARGGAGLVLHWPGFEDSGGDPHAVDFDRFVDACEDAVRHAPGSDDGRRWSIAGIRLGGAAAALATKRLHASSLVLVEPDGVGDTDGRDSQGRERQDPATRGAGHVCPSGYFLTYALRKSGYALTPGNTIRTPPTRSLL